MVSGVPIGDAQFARHKLGEVVQRSVSDNETLVNAFQNVAPQHLSCLQHCCCNSQFNRWLQHCHPPDVYATVKPLQDSLDAMFAAGFGRSGTFLSDPANELTAKRLRLPAKASGAGFRDLADAAPAAFLGASWQTLHSLTPRAGPGHHQPFEQTLEVGLFDESFQGSRHGVLMANPCPSSMEMAAAWARCRQDTPAAAPAAFGPLRGPVQDSGGSSMKRGQHHLTQFREKERGKLLHARMGALDPADPVEMAHFSVVGSPAATVVYTSWPKPGFQFSRVQWHELTHVHAEQPSPLLRPHAGRPIAGMPGSVVDAMGMNLVSSARLPGGGLRRRHDQVKWSLLEALRAMGLFSSVNSALGDDHMQANQRERQSFVPDFLWRDGDGD